jgi:hypothetical protein
VSRPNYNIRTKRVSAGPVNVAPAVAQRAVVATAAYATDADDLTELLAALGLRPEQGRPQGGKA